MEEEFSRSFVKDEINKVEEATEREKKTRLPKNPLQVELNSRNVTFVARFVRKKAATQWHRCRRTWHGTPPCAPTWYNYVRMKKLVIRLWMVLSCVICVRESVIDDERVSVKRNLQKQAGKMMECS